MMQKIDPVDSFSGQVIYILGAGRSGSTLLSMLLGSHPDIRSTGEIHRITHDARTKFEPCTCGQYILDCPFWVDVEKEACRLLGGQASERPLLSLDPMLRKDQFPPVVDHIEQALLLFPFPSIVSSIYYSSKVFLPRQEAVRNSFLWYESVLRATRSKVVVDATKDVRRYRALYLARRDAVKCIFLVRDGRAVAASMMRRTGASMRTAAYRWLDVNIRSEAVLMGVPKDRVLFLRYEDICSDPNSTINKAFDFIGVERHEIGQYVDKKGYHNIGGNPMRFRYGEMKIKLDDRWRRQLSSRDLRTFNMIAGVMNRKYGYID